MKNKTGLIIMIKNMIFGALLLLAGSAICLGANTSRAAETTYIKEVTVRSGESADEELTKDDYTVLYPAVAKDTWIGYRTTGSASEAITDICLGGDGQREKDGASISYEKISNHISGQTLYYTKNSAAGEPLMGLHFVTEGEDKEVEHVSNATNTTNRLVASISEAFTFVDELVRLDMPREESEVIELSKELVGEGATLTDITPKSGNTYLKRLYKVAEGGFVAYLVVISPNYGTPETETLIHFDNSGKIVSVNKLTWKTSDAIYGYEPPTEETVKAFYDKLAGNTSATFNAKFVKAEGEDKEVEHVANATNTTNRLVASIAEAFDFVDGLTQTAEQGGSNGARIVGIIILSLGILCPVGLAVFKKIRGRKEN